MTPPMVTTVDTLDPLMAPNKVELNTEVMAMPPGSQHTRLRASWISLPADFPSTITAPSSKKKGMQSREKFSSFFTRVWATNVSSRSVKMSMPIMPVKKG